MQFLKSIFLGSAVALVVVAAQAADLPTKKAAPAAEYVKICNVDGNAGFVIPGSDTCLKISGYVTAQIEAGNLTEQYVWAGNPVGTPAVGTSQTALAKGATTASRDGLGYSTRANLSLDAKSNTAYGVLTSHIDIDFDYGSGFDSYNSDAGYINHAYVNWAGITAGKAGSFFSFFGAGEGAADIFSADRRDENQPLLLAYTATFGGGFSGTISLEDPKLGGPSATLVNSIAGVDYFIPGNTVYQGGRPPIGGPI
jgi:hypothetical protein